MKAHPSFSPRLAVQIVDVSPLNENFSFALAKSFRTLSRLLFPSSSFFFFPFFSFTSIINKSVKNFFKNNVLILKWHLDFLTSN